MDVRLQTPPSGDARSVTPPSAPNLRAAPALQPVAVNVVPSARPASNSGAVVGVGLAMAAGAVLLASAFFSLTTTSLATSNDGRTLEADAQATLVLSFFGIAGSVGLFFVASKQLPHDRGWVIASLAGGAVVGFLAAQLMHAGALALATSPVHNGSTVVVWPYAPGIALIAAAGIGGAIVGAVRNWPMGAASAWLGCGLLAALGVALALFSSWTLSSAAELRAMAASRSHEVPGVGLALVVAAVGALVLLRRRR